MGFLKRFGKLGDKSTLLLFSDNFRNVTIEKGYTKIGRYFSNFRTKEGIEANISDPINLLAKGKIKEQVYPAYYDNASGIKFKKVSQDPPLGTGWETKYYRTIDGQQQEIPAADAQLGDEEVLYYTETYPGIPHDDKDGEYRFIRMVRFVVSPLVTKIIQDPRIVGNATDSNIFGDAIQMNPPIYKYLAIAIIMFLLGYAM